MHHLLSWVIHSLQLCGIECFTSLCCEQGGKPHVADFVHGPDGLGNVDLPDPTIKKVEESATDFLVDKVSRFPGEVSVLALGPLTNIALVRASWSRRTFF
jgi:inosine-uridine nucleoside N-ribohydrolase